MVRAVRIEGLKEYQAALKAAPAISKKVYTKALGLGATEVRSKSRKAIVDKGTTYQGGLQQRIKIKVTPIKAEVISDLPYSKVIHDGKRSGGQPPSEPLERWARIKLGKSGLGFVIARSIKKRGGITKPNPFMDTGAREAEPKVNRLLDQAHKQLVQFLAGKGVRI